MLAGPRSGSVRFVLVLMLVRVRHICRRRTLLESSSLQRKRAVDSSRPCLPHSLLVVRRMKRATALIPLVVARFSRYIKRPTHRVGWEHIDYHSSRHDALTSISISTCRATTQRRRLPKPPAATAAARVAALDADIALEADTYRRHPNYSRSPTCRSPGASRGSTQQAHPWRCRYAL